MEKTTQQELDEVNQKIERLEDETIPALESHIFLEKQRLDRLKEQRTNLLNYLNND